MTQRKKLLSHGMWNGRGHSRCDDWTVYNITLIGDGRGSGQYGKMVRPKGFLRIRSTKYRSTRIQAGIEIDFLKLGLWGGEGGKGNRWRRREPPVEPVIDR